MSNSRRHFEKPSKKSIIMGSDPLDGRLDFDWFLGLIKPYLKLKAFRVAHPRSIKRTL